MSPPPLPHWATALRDRYLAGEASLFLVHGNVRDVFPWEEDGATQWVGMRGFLEAFFGRTRDVMAYYNVSQGLQFPDRSQEQRFLRVINTARLTRGREALVSLPFTPAEAVPVVEELITNPAQPSAVILDFFEMIAPRADVSFMSAEDRANLVSLQRWASDPAFLQTDNIVVLITEHLADVSPRVIASPQLVTIQVPFPDQADRERFIRSSDLDGVELEMPLPSLAKVSAGLSLIQLRSLLRGARQSEVPVSFRTVSRRKKSIIEQECHGLVELVQPEHDFSHVGGMEGVKADLLRVSEAIKSGATNRVPMGMIFVGPMGTGKTFVAEAFAAESGLTCLKFKNFRDRWVGSTEANLEKILELVDALGYVLLILDEADRSLSAGEGDSGTSSRVIARLKEFMSDTSHRGRVLILMMTNRPDKLDTDLKRPGRFDVKIPFFFPETPDEREAILRAVSRRGRLDLAPALDLRPAVDGTAGYSAAELEAVLLAAASRAAEADREQIDQADLDGAVADVIPSRDLRMLEFMEMLAVFESSSRRMLPERLRHWETDEVLERLDQLRVALGRRAL
ncbi:MAG: ATP-binding protein [Deltaproteobacteria bacterium]|nr:ATP-binding protein [Deltaproteobacteria bacterium]